MQQQMETNTAAVDPKRMWWLVGGMVTFALPPLVIGIYFLGGQQPWIPLLLPLIMFGVLPALDAVVGEDPTNPSDDAMAALSEDPYYMWVARAIVIFAHFSVIGAIAFVATASLPWWSILGFLLGSGIIGGTLIAVAHELGHKPNPTDRLFARIGLGAVGYGHFTAEHNLGHHKNVATPLDCASGRLGESVYGFALRELPGAFMGGWRYEIARLKKRGLPIISHHNEILQSNALTLVIAAGLVAVIGWGVLPFLVLHHFFGWFALTIVNYIEHYGLARRQLENGRYEPTQPHHSWNTNCLVSNLMLLNLQRHSDHHTHPMRPYQTLRNFENLPTLPSGYPGSMALAAIPPLWFRVMDPKVKAWADGDVNKTNLHEPARGRLETAWAREAMAS